VASSGHAKQLQKHIPEACVDVSQCAKQKQTCGTVHNQAHRIKNYAKKLYFFT